MEPIPKIKLPVPYKSTPKIDAKLKSLSKIGSEKILTFDGSNEVEAMFYLYLFKKYKSNCFLQDVTSQYRLLGMSFLIDKKYTQEELLQINTHFDSLADILVDCITSPSTKIIIIPVQMYFSDLTAHANVLIYRKNLNQIEHFEPHGQNYSRNENDFYNKIIKKWMSVFVFRINEKLLKIKKPSIKFIESNEVCPYIDGLQNLESSSIFIKIIGEPIGYCAAWSMFFTELCLKNPEIPSSTLINYIFNTFQSMTNMEKGNYLKRVIRGYSVFINEKINKYFSVFFKSGELTIEKLKKLSGSELNNFRNIIKHLVNLEMNLTLDPFYLKVQIEKIQTELNKLNKDSKDSEIIMERIEKLTKANNFLNMYHEFKKNKISSPTTSTNSTSTVLKAIPRENSKIKTRKMKVKVKFCPEGKEINPKTGRCNKVKLEKRCPEGKVLNFKTSRCNKIKTQKRCPEGKILNFKTGRCNKIKTRKQKIKN